MLKNTKLTGVALAAILAVGTSAAMAETTTLRIQTHYAPDTVSGTLAAQYVDDIQVRSTGEIKVEMF
jgi:TRAP-type C4-dicarboxylate transport system substrate-binding protein